MKKYFVTLQVVRGGAVVVEADSELDAMKKAEGLPDSDISWIADVKEAVDAHEASYNQTIISERAKIDRESAQSQVLDPNDNSWVHSL